MLIKILLISLTIHYLYIYLTNRFILFFLTGCVSVSGLRGSGKTTLAVIVSYFANKLGYKVYSNFILHGSYNYEIQDIGTYDISSYDDKAWLIIDEAGIDFSNRKLFEKSMTGIRESSRKWFKLSRHYGVPNILILSQAQDFDIFLRRICDRHYLIENCWLHNGWSKLIPIRQNVNKEAEDFDSLFYFKVARIFLIYFNRKPFYNCFNSWEAPKLPHKDFHYYPLIDPNIKINNLLLNYKDYTEYIIDNKIDTGYS